MAAIDNGIKNAFVYWHRRCGKDKVLWNATIKRACELKGIHYYLLPTYSQARKIIWDGIDNDGLKFLDHVPNEIIAKKNGQEMKIELVNGSIIQLVGTDKYDALRGTNPITCIFSEYAYQNPMAYEVVKPILAANNGVAVFNTTPNGKNHAADLRSIAESRDDWFYEMLTINQTNVLSLEDIDKVREEGMSKEMIQQEFYCSEEAGVVGSYYSDQIQEIKKKNRICSNVYEKTLPVYTAWDIGYKDDTAIIFYQLYGKEIRIIDSYSSHGKTIPEYIEILKAKPYNYETHYFPWDAKITPMSSGKSTIDVAREYGMENIKLTPSLSVQEGINQARMILGRCWFEKAKTEELINALSNYKRKYDEKRKRYSKTPEHDWTSHFADAMRYVAISIKDEQPDTEDYEIAVKKLLNKNTTVLQLKKELGRTREEQREYEREARAFLRQ